MREDIKAGARFPDYELSDHTGTRRRISDIQGSNPMVLHLARGGYDPKEHRFLRQFADSYADFKVAYTRLLVITTDNQLDVNEFRDAVGAEFPFLADPERIVQKDLDIQEYTDPHDPMVPHTFVLAPEQRIFSVYNGYWYWGRPSLHELRLDLRELLRSTRPDFDLHAPGLREAWHRGERDQFLVESIEPAIRYTEGKSVGIKR